MLAADPAASPPETSADPEEKKLPVPAVDWQTFQVVPKEDFPASNVYLKIYAVPRRPRALAIDGDLFRAFREQVTEYFGVGEPTAPPWRPRIDAVELLWRKERVNAVECNVAPPLALHWMRGHDGSVGFATTIESLFAPGQVSLMDVAIDCLRFVRFAEALLGEEATLYLDFQPWKLFAVPGSLTRAHIRRIAFAGMPASMPGPDPSSGESIGPVFETFSASDLATPFAKLADMLVHRWRRIYNLHELSAKQIANTLGVLASEILHWGAPSASTTR